MRRRDIRAQRQQRRRERLSLFVAMVDCEEHIPARDDVCRMLGVTLDELRSLAHRQTTSIDLETTVKSRRKSRKRRVVVERTAAQSAPMRHKAVLAATVQRLRAEGGELADLVDGQERDLKYGDRVPKRAWLLSLDAPIFNDGDDGDTFYDVGGAYWGRRRGDFSMEAPWVPPLIDRIDRERERRAA